MPLWYQGTVSRIEQMTPDVKRFWIRTPGEQPLHFIPGQFITLDLPISDKRQARWRSYSIANAPGPDNELELCVVRLKDGAATAYLFEEVQVGAEIKFKEPFGTFTLPASLDKDLVMICTGTGVAPFRSMIRYIYDHDIPHRHLHLIFGARYIGDILYHQEFQALAAAHPEFSYDIALSRDAHWPGYKGYVHQVYLEKYAQPRPDLRFMICGWTKMIDEAVAHLLLDLRYDKSQVGYELYG